MCACTYIQPTHDCVEDSALSLTLAPLITGMTDVQPKARKYEVSKIENARFAATFHQQYSPLVFKHRS